MSVIRMKVESSDLGRDFTNLTVGVDNNETMLYNVNKTIAMDIIDDAIFELEAARLSIAPEEFEMLDSEGDSFA